MTLDRADLTVHPVETQWHWPILTAQGFVPQTLTAQGLVRSYSYQHANGCSVLCVTGVNADYWQGSDGTRGYWSDLATYVLPN